MASAEGMRFVIPVSTIHAAYNPRYFGRQGGSTLYSWTADTQTDALTGDLDTTARTVRHAVEEITALVSPG